MNQHESTKYEQHFLDAKTFLLTPGNSPDLLCKYLIIESVIQVLMILFGDDTADGKSIMMKGWANENLEELSRWVDVKKLSKQKKLDLGFDLNLDV